MPCPISTCPMIMVTRPSVPMRMNALGAKSGDLAPRASTCHPSSKPPPAAAPRSEEHTSELQSRLHLVCRLLLEKKNNKRQFIQNVHTRELLAYPRVARVQNYAVLIG